MDQQQMARCMESELDLLMCDALDGLDGNTIPRYRAATDCMDRGDLERVAV